MGNCQFKSENEQDSIKSKSPSDPAKSFPSPDFPAHTLIVSSCSNYQP